MYDIATFGRMIADQGRMGAYSRALQRSVRPDSTVLDIGAGTGILSLLACQYGARKVYAIEPTSAIAIAEEAGRANGFADRMECIQALSTDICLPQKADVIVSDLRGVLPLFQQHLPSIIDARQRLLAPGGTLIPRRDSLWAAVVEAPDIYNSHVGLWDGNGFGLRLESTRRLATNLARKA